MPSMITMPDDVIPIFAVIPPQHIAELKSILEAHEGLCIERTLDPERGEIVILAQEGTLAEVQELISSLGKELQLRVVPAPENIEGDWLLAPE